MTSNYVQQQVSRNKSALGGSHKHKTYDLNVEQYGMRMDDSNSSPWKQKAMEKLQAREEELKLKE